MAILVALLLGWIFLTLVGIGAIIRLMTMKPPTAVREIDVVDDLRAAARVVNRLERLGIIDREIAALQRADLVKLSLRDQRRPVPSQVSPQVRRPSGVDQDRGLNVEPRRPQSADASPPTPVQPPLATTIDDSNRTTAAQSLAAVTRPPASSVNEQPVAASEAASLHEATLDRDAVSPLAVTSVSSAASVPPAAAMVARPNAKQEPSLTMSEVIGSFLAAHNIRWGELVAGILIVVCSIGLVLSLWETITQTHRVVPSIIFLTFNTAIFAAGLYTLSRWRLFHTSRAMLVIATLLVPLSILAGLATTGTDAAAVSLTDPVTVAAILGIGAVYGVLLWLGSQALVGPRDAAAMVLSVAGPSAMLPLLPAAIRIWGSSAALLVGGGSVALFAALAWVVMQSKQTQRNVLGTAAGRHRVLIMSVGAFALAMLVGNVLHMLPDAPHRLLRIAVLLIPALVALAATGQSLTVARRRPNLALAGAVIFVLAALASFAVMPPAMVGAAWLWRWALVLSVAAVLAAIAFRQPLWLPIATVSSGLAVMFWSPMYFQSIAWQDIALWKRFIGGEPMLAALSIGATVLLVSRFVRQREYQKPLELAGVAWTGLALMIALVLCVAPSAWLGSVSVWVVTVVIGVVAAAAMGSPNRLIAKHAGWITIPFWLSIFRPVALGMPLAEPQVWMMTALTIAATLLVVSELARRWRGCEVIETWQSLSASVSVAAALIAVVFASHGWIDSAATLAASTLLLAWIGIAKRQATWVQTAQLVSLAAACVIGWGRFSETLLSQQSWQAADAPWGWSVLFAALTLVWLFAREMICLATSISDGKPWLRGLSWYGERTSQTRPIESIMLLATLGAIAVAAVQAFASLVIGIWRPGIFEIQISFGLPAVGVIGAGVALYLAGRRLQPREFDVWQRLELAASVCVLIWSGVQLAIGLLDEPAQQLVLATSVVALLCLAADAWIRSADAPPSKQAGERDLVPVARVSDVVARSIPAATGVAVVGLATLTLLGDWCVHVFAGETPQTFSTWAMAAWALFGAVAAGQRGYQLRDSASINLSSVLTPAAVLLAMPLWLESPIVWIQWATLASVVWALVVSVCFRGQRETIKEAVAGSVGVTFVVGSICAVAMIASVLGGADSLSIFGSVGGVMVSVIAAAIMIAARGKELAKQRWPVGITFLSGQLTWIAISLNWVGGHETQWLTSIWLVGAAASTVLYAANVIFKDRPADALHFWHAGAVSFAVCLLSAIGSGSVADWIGMAACVMSGLLVTIVAWQRVSTDESASQYGRVVTARVLGWLVLGLGSYFVIQLADASRNEWHIWTVLCAWFGFWIVWWRLSCPDTLTESGERGFPLSSRVLPDAEATLLITMGLIGELVMVVGGSEWLQLASWSDPLLWVRVVVACAIAATVGLRGDRKTTWETSIAVGIAAVALVAVRIGIDYGADWQRRFMLASVTPTTVIAMLVYSSGTLLALAEGGRRGWVATLDRVGVHHSRQLMATNISTRRFADALWRIGAVAVTLISAVIAVQLCSLSTDPNLPLTIGAVALIAVAFSELASITGEAKMRFATVAVGFVAIGMWASINVGLTQYPILTTSMQWLVAWVFTATVVAIVVPKLFGKTIAARWQDALKFGVTTAGVLAAGSLTVMFVQEIWVHNYADIDLVSRAWVYFIASTLAALSVVATLLSVLSGPGFSYREIWQFSDQTRKLLILAAQVAGGLTWLHLHLCKSPLAHLGLRPYWPYIVMGLAFVSVGITEWAQRRGDRVLTQTLRQTALYLPLIPVLGFWLSGATFGLGDALPTGAWSYIQGRVSYQSLLVIGAIYYAGISFLWKGTMPRVASMVLGNAALWVILIQTPNWDFLTHPQAWLIPPAVCVLLVAHLYRNRLEPGMASAIRYAATLMIYISSTADMLLQDIGSTLAGPIILVLLALSGMGAGVVLRVRPFLYLGAIFVFIGVTSMVWHAQQRIDEVWPWWAFGITTGILLLAGLMAIEKNKPKLRTLAHSLASWES